MLKQYLGEKIYLDIDSENGIRKKRLKELQLICPFKVLLKMIKVAMVAIQEELTKNAMKSKMILQIHDELIFECPQGEEDLLVNLVVGKMENAMKLSVPVFVDYGWEILA